MIEAAIYAGFLCQPSSLRGKAATTGLGAKKMLGAL
jgi:hypothetical protein